MRTRVCGVLITGDRILLVGHKGLGSAGMFWSPPGGGIEFGERAEEALRREFLEETGLEVNVREFLFVNEFISEHLHAVEFFFRVEFTGGELQTGLDPELADSEQVIAQARFFSDSDLRGIQSAMLPPYLANCEFLDDILKIRGYIASIGN